MWGTPMSSRTISTGAEGSSGALALLRHDAAASSATNAPPPAQSVLAMGRVPARNVPCLGPRLLATRFARSAQGFAILCTEAARSSRILGGAGPGHTTDRGREQI